MELTLIREIFTKRSTVGRMYVDGKFACYTLEDPPRAKKVAKVTCIPAGKYRVVIDDSPRFKRRMPHVLGVPGFEGIRIHWGVTPEHTDGCILVGCGKAPDMLTGSRVAFDALFAKLEGASETVTLEILEVPCLK